MSVATDTEHGSSYTKVALVTGAGQGIGRAIALRLAADGFCVGLNDMPTNSQRLDSLVEEIAAAHGESGVRACVAVADVKVEDEVKAMLRTVVKEFGGLDVMVANAGIGYPSSILELSVDEWDNLFAVNVRGTFLCYKYAAEQMIAQGAERGGRIIGASSIVGKSGFEYLSAYSATKFAIRGLTQSAARELGRHGITVNAYAPGAIVTPMLQNLQKETVKRTGDPGGFYKFMEDHTALGYLGDPQDIASLVSFIVSKESRYITGQTITVDGGYHFD